MVRQMHTMSHYKGKPLGLCQCLLLVVLQGWLALGALAQRPIDSLQTLLQQSTNDQQRVDLYCALAEEKAKINFQEFEAEVQKAIELAQRVNYSQGLNKAYYALGKWYYLSGAYNKSIPYLQKVQDLAPRVNDTLFHAKSLNVLALINERNGNYDTSLEYYAQSLALRQQLHDLKGVSLVYTNMASIYKAQGDYKKALAYYEKALGIAQAQQSDKGVARVYNGMGLVYKKQGKHAESLAMFLKCLQLYEAMNNTQGVIANYTNIGMIYDVEKNHKKALEYYFKALKLQDEQSIQNQQTRALIYNNIGVVYKEKGQYQKALDFHFKSLAIKEKENNRTSMVYSYENIGVCYFHQKKTKEALEYLEKALQLSESIGLKSMSAVSLVYLGELYISTKEYVKARDLFLQSKALAEKVGEPAIVHNNLGLLARVEEQLQNYKAAYHYQVQFKQVSDSLLNLEKSRQIADLNTRYETEKKEQQIQNLKQSTEIKDLQLRQSTLSLTVLSTVLALFILLGIILYLFYRQKQFQLQKKHYEVEQKLLRVQMNPHFIFNALAAIQQYLFEASSQKASFYLAKFSRLMRQVLEHSRHEYITLEEEIAMLDNYLSLQNLRQKQPFEYNISVDDQIDPEAVCIPPMFAQPFVENAIEHGISHLAETGHIQITFALEGEQIILTVQDNGVGIPQAAQINAQSQPNHQSLATQITQERMSVFKQNYKKDVTFRVEHLDQGTRVVFHLPYQSI